ncbi:uncharacterized protein LOC121046610 [Ixodes scapularis]|uniref:uncharacterized protein LOC121046610 n=1 Tax=Ixodes scapularis TaxID=6945 RepID=UPI001AD7BE3B|nr:uncharacterized protein LOC121046610 [Ixodes scapularis]
MAHMPCFCISQAFLALLLLWSSPCTNASASYPALFLQSPDCGGYQCSVSGAFSDLPRLDQPLFTATASTTATSIPAANLNCQKTDRFFSGHGSSNNDSMAHMPCFCISQSFLPRTSDEWNRLPASIATIEDSHHFKNVLANIV